VAEVMHSLGYEQGKWHRKGQDGVPATDRRSWRKTGVDPHADDDIPA
jgi:hypothetical protein